MFTTVSLFIAYTCQVQSLWYHLLCPHMYAVIGVLLWFMYTWDQCPNYSEGPSLLVLQQAPLDSEKK